MYMCGTGYRTVYSVDRRRNRRFEVHVQSCISCEKTDFHVMVSRLTFLALFDY